MGNYYARRDGEPKWGNVIFATIAFLGILGAVILAGHFFGWWLVADSTNRQAQVNQQSYGYQQSRQADLSNLIGTVATINTQIPGAAPGEQTALRGQRHAIVAQACAAAVQINQMPAEQAPWVAQNCAVGAPMPDGPNT